MPEAAGVEEVDVVATDDVAVLVDGMDEIDALEDWALGSATRKVALSAVHLSQVFGTSPFCSRKNTF